MPCTWSSEEIRRLPVFSALPEAELTALMPSIRRRTFEAQACIIGAGTVPEGLYVIVSGRVRLVHQDQEGRALIADTFGAGDIFGEMGLIDASACPASAVTVELTEVAFISREPTLAWLDSSARAANALLRISLQRLCKAHRQMADLALTKVYTRVAQVLVDNGRDMHGEWHVDVGSQQIAALVGASREMVSRVLRCMIEKQLIRRYKRKLIVIDREALRAAATPAAS